MNEFKFNFKNNDVKCDYTFTIQKIIKKKLFSVINNVGVEMNESDKGGDSNSNKNEKIIDKIEEYIVAISW